MHCDDEPSNDSAANQATATESTSLQPAKTRTALIIKAGLIFVPPLVNSSFRLSNLIPLHLPCAQILLLRYSPWFHILCMSNLMQSDACFIHPTFVSLRAMTRLRVRTLKPRLDVVSSNISSSLSRPYSSHTYIYYSLEHMVGSSRRIPQRFSLLGSTSQNFQLLPKYGAMLPDPQ